MKIAAAWGAAFLLAGTSAFAQEAKLDRVVVDQFGIYSGTSESAVPAPDTAAGKIERVDQVHLAQSTHSIPGKKGVRFGFHYKVFGTPPGAVVPLRMVTIFPPPGMTNSETNQHSAQSEYVAGVPVGEGRYAGYTMSDDWEVLPGIWTFQIWSGDKKMSEQHFMVMKK